MMEPLAQARTLFLEGLDHFKASRLADARRCFEQALALAPGRVSVMVNLGITLCHLGEFEAAEPLLRGVTEVEPDDAAAWAYLGQARASLGHWAAACLALVRSLALEPVQAPVWLALGRCRVRLGEIDAALTAFTRATETDPALEPAWSARGGLLRETGRFAEAAQAFRKAQALGADPQLLGYYLAAVDGGEPPPSAPRQYVEGLFDEYAAEFGEHLVGHLRYQAPQTLLAPLIRAAPRYRQVLDLGCGSGLCGSIVHPFADAIDGVDLSRAMLAQAGRLGVYRDLVHQDIASFLATAVSGYELVLAADVFIYVGELEAIFTAVRRVLAPGGCFAFSVELPPEGIDTCLLPSLRYAHSEVFVRQLADRTGFRVREARQAPLREEQRRPVPGCYLWLD
jgi:predicted TPR repeat methyltransferase